MEWAKLRFGWGKPGVLPFPNTLRKQWNNTRQENKCGPALQNDMPSILSLISWVQFLITINTKAADSNTDTLTLARDEPLIATLIRTQETVDGKHSSASTHVRCTCPQAVSSRWVMFTLNSLIVRPPRWFTAALFGVRVYILRSANTTEMRSVWCLFPQMSLSQQRHTFVVKPGTSAHQTTFLENHYQRKRFFNVQPGFGELVIWRHPSEQYMESLTTAQLRTCLALSLEAAVMGFKRPHKSAASITSKTGWGIRWLGKYISIN